METLRYLWKDLVEFYRRPEYFERFYAIKERCARAESGCKISLRMIEYFLTNYTLTTEPITYVLAKDSTDSQMPHIIYSNLDGYESKKCEFLNKGYKLELFNVRLEYQKQITSIYHKRLFDPCCRGKKEEKFIFVGPNDLKVETTLKQMVFFKWALQNCVIDWITDNAGKVVESMRSDEYAKKKRKRDGNTIINFKPRFETLKRKTERLKLKSTIRGTLIVQTGENVLLID